MSVLDELRRRNVIKVASAYVVMAWLLVQVVETLFPIFGLSRAAIRVVVIVLAVGFVPTVIAAWAFEWTPYGIKLDSDAAVDADTRQISGQRLNRIFLVVLGLAVGFFAIDKFVFDPARDATREEKVAERARSEAITGYYGNRSIAVLPFVNMSSDPEQEYFADGISEEVLNLLARIRELRVISRSSAFTFKGKDLEIPEIAERLNVGHILEGSVRRSGDSVRVTAQLIEARTDTHLWSQTYNRKLEDIFAIQDEIARDVTQNLELQLLQPLPRSRVTDPEVLALTMQADHLAETRHAGFSKDMHALLSKALEIDPDYVPALELMSRADWFLGWEGFITTEEADERNERMNARILQLEPDNPTVLAFEAWNEFKVEGNHELAAVMYKRAVATSLSDSEVIRLAATYAARIGHFDTARRLAEHSVAVDPLCYMCVYWLSRINMYAGDYEAALESREHFLRLGSAGGNYHYGLIKLLQGDPASALVIFETMIDPEAAANQSAGLAMTHYDLGNVKESKAALERLRSIAGDDIELVSLVADVAAWTGDNDTAFAIFEQIVNATDQHGQGLVNNPAYTRLHADPRWTEFRNRIGMSEERLATIEFNPELPE